MRTFFCSLSWGALICLSTTLAACGSPEASAPTQDNPNTASEAQTGAQALKTCNDTPPPGSTHTCIDQSRWGKCSESWMVGFCDRSCGRCLNEAPHPMLNFGYDFEDGATQGWTGNGISDGPWSVDEWSASGQSALKAHVDLRPDGDSFLSVFCDEDLSAMKSLSAVVRRSAWGSWDSGMIASLYVRTGASPQRHETAQWYLDPSPEGRKLDLVLDRIPDLNHVREIGVRFHSLGNSGRAAVYVDNVNAQNAWMADVAPGEQVWTKTGTLTFDESKNSFLVDGYTTRTVSRIDPRALFIVSSITERMFS